MKNVEWKKAWSSGLENEVETVEERSEFSLMVAVW